jgi:hypothetical protein
MGVAGRNKAADLGVFQGRQSMKTFATTVVSAVLVFQSVPAAASHKVACLQTLIGWSRDGSKFAVREKGCQGKGSVRARVYDMVTRRWSTGIPRRLRLTRAGGTKGKSYGGMKVKARKLGNRFYFEITRRRSSTMLGKSPRLAFHAALTKWQARTVLWGPGGRFVLFKMSYTDSRGYLIHQFYGFLVKFKLVIRQGVTRDRGSFLRGGRRIWVTFESTSTLATEGAYAMRPRNLLDRKKAWCEAAPGKGIGQKVTYRFSVKTRISGYEIKPGYHFRPQLWKKFNRVRKLEILTSNKTKFIAVFHNRKSTVKVRSPKGAERVRWVSFKIKSVYPGTSKTSNDTCITMIRPF